MQYTMRIKTNVLNYTPFHQEYEDDNRLFSVIVVVYNSYDIRPQAYMAIL